MVGIIIGQFVTPDIKAQNNGVFDEITCRQLKVVDCAGRDAIGLVGIGPANGIYILDKSGNTAIRLAHFPDADENSIHLWDPADKKSFEFNAYRDRNELIVRDKSSGAGIGFYADSNEAKQTTWAYK